MGPEGGCINEVFTIHSYTFMHTHGHFALSMPMGMKMSETMQCKSL